jgi:hypothetical protein
MFSFRDTGGEGSGGGREHTTRKPTGWREMATGIVCDTKNLQTKGFAFIKPDTGETATLISYEGQIRVPLLRSASALAIKE